MSKTKIQLPEAVLQQFQKRVGLPIGDDWIEQETERIFRSCDSPGICGWMRRQAQRNKILFEQALDREARILAYRSLF